MKAFKINKARSLRNGISRQIRPKSPLFHPALHEVDDRDGQGYSGHELFQNPE